MTRSCKYEFGTFEVRDRYTDKQIYTGMHLDGVPVGVGRYESPADFIKYTTTVDINSHDHGFEIVYDSIQRDSQVQNESRYNTNYGFSDDDGLKSRYNWP